MTEPTDKAREEFFSEAQELIEALSRCLLEAEAELRVGRPDPSTIDEAFRAVHTLKGLAGLFAAHGMGALAHRLEDVLDDARMGRRPVDASLLDVLFQSVTVFSQVLVVEREGSSERLPALEQLLLRLAPKGATPLPSVVGLDDYDIDPALLAVLTEYEEHRLRSNVAEGMGLFRLRVRFDLATIDTALEHLKDRARAFGEIITYLPGGDTGGVDTIELELLLASSSPASEIQRAFGDVTFAVEELPRRSGDAATGPPSQAPHHTHAPSQAPAASPLARASGNTVAPPPPVVAEPEASLRSLTQTVRVDIRKLDRLMNVVGELSIVRGNLTRALEQLRVGGHSKLVSELFRLNRTFDRRLTDLQNGILEVRMVPLGQVFDRLARVVRQISRNAGKEIRLVITGAETEIDKLIVEELSDPLMHIIRNAIDHGIEPADKRGAVGKAPEGTVALNAFQKGSHVVIEVEDDGAGINGEALVRKAVAMGRVEASDTESLSHHEILNLIFMPGLTTRDEVSDLSGRGVGMDVVKTNISRLGGVIDVQTERGIGTKFTITLPITLAIMRALSVRVVGHTFALPLNTVSEAIAFQRDSVRSVEGREVLTVRGTSLPLCRLDRLFRLERPEGTAPAYVVVTALGNRRLGLLVDHIAGQQDIVIKALGASLRGIRGFSGATELADQRVVLVIDAAAIIEEVLVGLELGEAKEHRPWLTS